MFRKWLLGLILTASGLVHAQVPVSGLPPASTPLTGNEVIILNQNNATKQTKVLNLLPLAPPLSATYILESPNVGIPNSRTLAGTANEITLTDAGALGNLTLSTPQPIALTSSPTFAGLTLTNPLTTPNGGTGFASYAVGDLLTAGGTTVLSKLPDVATGNVLLSGGVGIVPSYGKVTPAAFSGILTVPNGGTGVGTLTGLALGNGTANFSAYAGTSCTNQFPRSLNASGVATCASVANTDLINSSITINGTSVALGGARTLTLASADFVNQGTTTTVLHGNAAGNPSFTSVTSADLAAGVFANPTGLIGMTAVNGTATTATRSDGHSAIDPAIGPTWTANHSWVQTNVAAISPIIVQNASTGTAAAAAIQIENSTHSLELLNTSSAFSGSFLTGGPAGESANIFTTSSVPLVFGTNSIAHGTIASAGNWTIPAPTSGNTLTVTGAASSAALLMTAGAGSGVSLGPDIRAGTTTADFALTIRNQAGSVNYFQVRGDGAILGGGPTAGALVDMTPDTGSLNLTPTGFAAVVPTVPTTWAKMGNIICVDTLNFTGTSNAVTFTMGTLPASIRPVHLQSIAVASGFLVNAGAGITNGAASLDNTGVITLYIAANPSGWTATGTKASSGVSFCYNLN